MSILCLITVGALLLSIANAESGMPIGPTGQYQHYNHHHHRHPPQRLPRPIILQPIVKSESSPLDWFLKMVSRAIEPINTPAPAIILPINIPGRAGQVYIRQLENRSPWETNRVVVKMVNRDPVTGMNVPIDPIQSYHRTEDNSRRLPKSYGYPMNNPSGRSNNMFQQDYQTSSIGNQYYNSPNNYRSRNQYYQNPYTKSLRSPTINDFRHDDYAKNQNHDFRSFPSRNYNNDNYQRFQPMTTISYRDSGLTTIASPLSMYGSMSDRETNQPVYGNEYNDQRYKNNTPESQQFNDFHWNKPDSSGSTQIPYPDHASRLNDENFRKINNITGNNENSLSNNNFPTTPVRYRQFGRNDRMIHNYGNHSPLVTPERTKFRISSNTQDSRGFRQGPITKFDLNDVTGGLEVIAPPNLKHNNWRHRKIANDENQENREKSEDSDINEGDDSISMGNGKNLARGESAEHVNDEQTESQTTRIMRSRLSTYKVIDRSHRSYGSQNVSMVRESREKFDGNDDEMKLRNENEKEESRASNVTSDEVAPKVSNVTASNRWKFQEGRQPSRVVKAIYRRRPMSEIVKNGSRESTDNISSNEKINSNDNSSEN